jgi:magnesium-transporting ATPase (P-type)
VQGKSIVDESNLTGESIPVNKTPLNSLSNDIYHPEKDQFKKNSLFAGSRLI